MVKRLIVPVDGSTESWRALDVALPLARRCVAPILVVEVALSEADVATIDASLSAQIDARQLGDVEVTTAVIPAIGTVAETLADLMEQRPDATVVMASHGRGRSAAVLGSVAEDLLHREFGPILVVGPAVVAADFEGPIIVTVDGSDLSEEALPLGAAWAIELGLTPWVVEVNAPSTFSSEHLVEASYTSRMARTLRSMSGHQTEFEVLHDRHPHDGVAEFARDIDASMIVAATHGRTGFARLRSGSEAAAFVRRAPCPVLLIRPPHLQEIEVDGSLSAAAGD